MAARGGATACYTIWADGKLLRGAAGDLKVPGTLRFHDGAEGQEVDPLISAVEGAGAASAFRGLALAVFEDLSLGEFGNRIPMLTFEVVADEGAIRVGAVIADISGGVIESAAATLIEGYAAHGSDRRGAIEPLAEIVGLKLRDGGSIASDRGSVERTAADKELGCTIGETGAAMIVRSRTPLGELPASLTLGFYDPARDYQTGVAGAGETGGRTGRTIELAAAISAEGARALADQRLTRMWAERETVVLQLPPAFLDLQPGDAISGGGLSGRWTVTRVEVTSLVVMVKLVRQSGRAAALLPADGGRASPAVDRIAAPTQLVLLDLPDLGWGGTGPALWMAAASAGAWRAVPVGVEVNGIEQAPLLVERAAIVGVATTVLESGCSVLRDEAATVVVRLVDPSAWLTSCNDDALAMGVNLAAIGDELFQFGRADALGGGTFRLSRLLRGRRGSEWAMAGHRVGEPFVLLDKSRLTTIALPDEMLGAAIAVRPHGLGDASSAPVTRTASGESLRPPSPCQIRAHRSGSGLVIDWVRRSRSGWAWSDGCDAPLGEAAERYRIRISAGDAVREWTVFAPTVSLTTAELGPLASEPLMIGIAQLGDRGVSRDSIFTLTLKEGAIP